MDAIVIKISGNVVADFNALGNLCEYVKKRKGEGLRIVMIHGGGRQISELSQRTDVPVRQVAGRRITDEATREILLYTVGGRANREIVAFLRRNDIPSVGISGIDGGLTTAHRRPPMDIDGNPVDFGLVGEIDSVDTKLLEHLTDGGFLPVVGCLTYSEDDGILNINADTFAIRISLALQVRELVMLMDPPAVLDARKKPIDTMNRRDWQRGLEEGWITDGMKPKLLTAFEALDNGVQSVLLTNAGTLAAGGGTRLVADDKETQS
ncbi:acetylglutamate kinase [Natronogracilivirga saccharolytica]|uniref:Acetylglutamate kinase n=1 Tax=Natronogracilivirga saccharolytica TaxID=2812953 RepID=A0A8J7S7M4_9BACT|nr:acetylglutamate kinase [Natronogracilivirga saccharolytica]MBP3191636.1 acetylglutamate kinase [Natronogracilivirga saccharolytica]